MALPGGFRLPLPPIIVDANNRFGYDQGIAGVTEFVGWMTMFPADGPARGRESEEMVAVYLTKCLHEPVVFQCKFEGQVKTYNVSLYQDFLDANLATISGRYILSGACNAKEVLDTGWERLGKKLGMEGDELIDFYLEMEQ